MENLKEQVELKQLDIQTITVKIFGVAPLIMHRWSEKAKKEMLDKHMGKAKNKKHEIKNPQEDYDAATYWIGDKKSDRFGFPAVAFKAAMVRAAKSIGLVMIDFQTAVFVRPNEGDLVEIFGHREMREDMVVLNKKSPDIRHRPQIVDWKAVLTIDFNSGVTSRDEVVQALMSAGFSVGVGEWRPGKSASGSYGTWRVDTEGI